jgi:hypothetical protein
MPNPVLSQPALSPHLAALLAPLGSGVVQRVAQAAARPHSVSHVSCHAQSPSPSEDDLAILESELASLLAARDLLMSWVKRMAGEEGRPAVNPAQFLRAWSDSTGRVIQLLKARRELSGGPDDLLDAVYAELEAELLRAPAAEPAQEDAP